MHINALQISAYAYKCLSPTTPKTKGALSAKRTGNMHMPLYGYYCKICDKEMDLLVDSDAAAACRYCGSGQLERLISRVAQPGRSRDVAKAMRSQAGREGHLSNFTPSERGR